MRIYAMKATFGKLEHQVLTLKPGLNIIEAPNEWGKSTWCAFLIAMLYGIDTRSKSTRQQLSDKERFQPWSGAAMEGRIDLNWNGRDITIERSTQGRIPMGEFHAYETRTGLQVSELTAENCGRQLLGVEKEVFTRSAFLRFSDLPVTEDEQLRSRLNALVTTGDESGQAELLERKLKELKNRCRYHKTGLIPQLRLQKEKAEQKLEEYETLDQQIQQLQAQIKSQEGQVRILENHRAALHHQEAQEQAALLQEAKAAKEAAHRQLEALRDQVEVVPSRETAVKNLRRLTQLQEDLADIQTEEQMLSTVADPLRPPPGFEGCSPRQAVIQARRHRDEIDSLLPGSNLLSGITFLLGSFLLLFSLFLLIFDFPLWCGICAATGIVYVAVAVVMYLRHKKQLARYQERIEDLTRLYGCGQPDRWVETAERYAREMEAAPRAVDDGSDTRAQLHSRKEALVAKIMILTRSRGLGSALEYWQDILSLWDEYADARCNHRQADRQYQNLCRLHTDAPPPQEEDTLSCSMEETDRLLGDASRQLRQLVSKLGQYQGYADSLGSRESLEAENAALEQRLHDLEKTYAALDFALKSLAQASAELQRRFAPRISQSAQEILGKLTDGRYNRLTMSQDFSLLAGAQNEDIIRSRHWRSDGTVDQLYLALRLAVARELLPNAPLVLDDAMVRFDNVRLQAALEILKQEARTRQVILFTCHGRERTLLEE